MDWLAFFASIIASLAWPLTVIILVILLRDPLTRVLLTLTHLKYKDLEIDFKRELEELEEKAKAIDVKPQLPEIRASEKKDTLQFLAEARQLAAQWPEGAVTLAWQAVEHELMF